MTMDLQTLAQAVEDDAAFRVKRRLQPIGGPGDKIFPPTYPPPQGSLRNAPPRHVFRATSGRWRRGGGASCSTASRAKPIGLKRRCWRLPKARTNPCRCLSSRWISRARGWSRWSASRPWMAPHRVYDAILRDSLLDGSPFMQSEEGRRLAAAKPADATALLELSPNALLFGAWHSQGEGGGFGAKFPRALVSEIMGVDTPVEELAASRRTGQIEARGAGRSARLGDLMLVAGGDVEGRSAGRRTGSRNRPTRHIEGRADLQVRRSGRRTGHHSRRRPPSATRSRFCLGGRRAMEPKQASPR